MWQFFYKGAYSGVAVRLRCRPFQQLIWRCGILKPKLPTCRFTSYSAARLREGVMVYCHTTGHSIDEALDDYARHQELVFKAIRVQCGIPGMKATYRI